MKRKGGKRRKTRKTFTKSSRRKGKVSITQYLKQYDVGDRVTLSLEPSINKGVYDTRYKGHTGIITEKRGECYEVRIKDRGKEKHLVVHPVHLR